MVQNHGAKPGTETGGGGSWAGAGGIWGEGGDVMSFHLTAGGRQCCLMGSGRKRALVTEGVTASRSKYQAPTELLQSCCRADWPASLMWVSRRTVLFRENNQQS